MADAYLGLGSNLGDRACLIDRATARIAALPTTRSIARSSRYRTPPWGDLDQGEFLNAALHVETSLGPHALLDACLAIETALGRVRERRWGPRVVDIDILHIPGVAVASERLTLPHPLWRERAFVLVPLAEIAPDLVVGGMRVADALAALDANAVAAVQAYTD